MFSTISFSHKGIYLFIKQSNSNYYSFKQIAEIASHINRDVTIFTLNKPSLLQTIKPELSKKIGSNFVDILDIFILLYPRVKCSPTITGVYRYIFKKTLPKIANDEAKLKAEAQAIQELLQQFILEARQLEKQTQEHLISLAYFLQDSEPQLAEFLLSTINLDKRQITLNTVEVWNVIPDYKKTDKEDSVKINTSEIPEIMEPKFAIDELQKITAHKGGMKVEQQSYVACISKMFQGNSESKQFVFAEAATGTGKTLGYLAGVLAFLQQNPRQQVLISTYSKALQRQVYQELQNSLPYSSLHTKISIIKGNNNYVCLLNYEYLLNNPALFPRSSLFLAVLSIWLKDSKYGDLVGGDISPLLFHLFSKELRSFVLNHHDECLYSKCKHFKKCFIINTKKRAFESNIVVSNHYYSLLNANLGIKYAVFDEAHHLISTADEVFSLSISAQSMAQFNYWLFGSQNYKRASIKKELNGFKQRINTLLQGKETDSKDIQDINSLLLSLSETLLESCSSVVSDFSSVSRITVNSPNNLMESFLSSVYQYVLNHNDDLNNYYSLETLVNHQDFNEEFNNNANKLIAVFEQALSISSNMYTLLQQRATLVEEEDKYEVEDFIKLFENKFITNIVEYINMLNEMMRFADKDFIYRFVVEKEEGTISNIAYYKNYINPAQPLVSHNLLGLNGVTLTSATLTDTAHHVNNEDVVLSKKMLISRYGGSSIVENFNISTTHINSTFNYKENSKIIIVNNSQQHSLSSSIEQLFKAGGGGGLALFTALNRLNLVYKNIYNPLLESGINLMSTSINNQKIENLIDIFKDDENSCLLGSDSARDGIDIPGNSLRLVIFEKTPWAKADLLHKARVKHLGSEHSLELIRLKLRQALGRIIRTHEDRGIFVILDKAFPSALNKAFPLESEISKLSLNEATKVIKDFLSN